MWQELPQEPQARHRQERPKLVQNKRLKKAAAKKVVPKKKASPKKTVIKRPSTKESNGNGNKTGGRAPTLQDKTTSWTKAVAQSDQENEDSAGEGEERRDPKKGQEVQKAGRRWCHSSSHLGLDRHSIQKADNPRKEKTALINGLFTKNAKGGYDMMATAPVFEQAKAAYYKRYGKDESTGFPKDVFLWQTFHGNKEALEAAIANGSVQ